MRSGGLVAGSLASCTVSVRERERRVGSAGAAGVVLFVGREIGVLDLALLGNEEIGLWTFVPTALLCFSSSPSSACSVCLESSVMSILCWRRRQ